MRFLILALLAMAACAPFQNLTVANVRTDAHLHHHGSLQMPIEQALICAERTNFACGAGGSAWIEKCPDGSGAFSMFVYGMGRSRSNPYMILDVTRGDGGTTEYRGYTIMPTWASTIQDQLQRIEACGDCSKLP